MYKCIYINQDAKKFTLVRILALCPTVATVKFFMTNVL
jgi:hypothetical protein